MDPAILPLPSTLIEGLRSLGISRLLPTQVQTLPAMLAGHDVLARAETGSGKTLAFALAVLAKLEPGPEVQALVICPTRELAEQVSTEVRRLARRTPNVKVLTLGGGVPFAPQRASLKHGAHVVVGTPGRLEEHVRKGSLALDSLRVLVLDEADRMLDMGFEPALAQIVAKAPAQRQTLLFSATYPESISDLSSRYQTNAVRIDVQPELHAESSAGEGRPRVEQRFVRVSASEHLTALAAWLARKRPEAALVFCNTRLETVAVVAELRARGWVAASIHGEMSQRERSHVVRLFANGSCSVLVATDLAARGWDIPTLPVVINLGLSRDPTVHAHRVGRTGRSGVPGVAVSFVGDDDLGALDALVRMGAVAWETPIGASPLSAPPSPRRATLLLSGGKDKKLRPGDVLGALTAPGGIDGACVGPIQIEEDVTYVAVDAGSSERALVHLRQTPIKGRSIRVRRATLEL